MIKLKKPKKSTTPKKTSIFIYKNLDTEFTHECKSTYNLRYNAIEGYVEFRPTDEAIAGWERMHGMQVLLSNTYSFAANFLIFRMCKINGFKMEVHSTYESDLYTNPYSLGHIVYGLRFYPTKDTLLVNPFAILKDPRTMIVSTKQPFHSQELIFPKQYVVTSDSQGYGRWISTDYNVLYHDIESSLQIGTQYQGYWTSHIPMGLLTVTFNVSFRDFRN